VFVDRVNQALWDDLHQNMLAQNVSERVFDFMRQINVNFSYNSCSVRQLPPSVIDIEGPRAAFPLGLGHAVDYVSERAALIG